MIKRGGGKRGKKSTIQGEFNGLKVSIKREVKVYAASTHNKEEQKRKERRQRKDERCVLAP